MASTYSTSLQIQLIANGEQSNVWGTSTNTNWNLIEQAVAGSVSITMTNANYTLSVLNGVSDEARNAVLFVGGTNSAIRQIIAPLVPKVYVVFNNTSGGYAITIGGSTGTLVTIPSGASSLVFCDGTNFYSGISASSGNFAVPGNLTVTGNETIGGNLSVTGTSTFTGDITGDLIGNVTGDLTGNVSGDLTGNVDGILGGTTPAAATVTSLSDSGNLSFTGTGNRITGDFTNATLINRVAIQTSTSNGNTYVSVLPNGTSTLSSVDVYNAATATNASVGSLRQSGTATQVIAGKNGTGTYGNLEFWAGNSRIAYIDSSSDYDFTLASNAYTIKAGGGYKGKQGSSGSVYGNAYNFWWTNTEMQLWVDTTNIGTLTLSSDYRVKKNIETNNTNALDRIMALRPVTYEFTDYKIFKADGVKREGFIAHEVAEIIPSAVNGIKDDENQIQSLKLDALVSVLTKAVQELSARVKELENK